MLCLAFPVHPPGRPEKDRLAELAAPTVPVLVVQGERDPFGRPEPAPGREVVLLRGDHSLKSDAPGLRAAVTALARAMVMPLDRARDLRPPCRRDEVARAASSISEAPAARACRTSVCETSCRARRARSAAACAGRAGEMPPAT